MNKIRFLGASTALGALVVLGGCVAVPSGPVYSDGYYSNYPGTVYSDPAPVYVQPPSVYIDGGYSHGPRYWDGGRWNHGPGPGHGRPGYGPRHGYGPRPGYVPPPVVRPGLGVVPRPGFGARQDGHVAPPPPGTSPRDTRNIRPFSQEPAGGS